MIRRTTSTTAGGTAGEAIGRLGGRRDVGRGASSESFMLARHVSNEFVDFISAAYNMTLLISFHCVQYDFVDFFPLRTI